MEGQGPSRSGGAAPEPRQLATAGEAASADLQLLRLASRSASPAAASARGQLPASGGVASGAAGTSSGGGSVSGGSAGALSAVVDQTFSDEALGRLQHLRAQLGAAAERAGSPPPSPPPPRPAGRAGSPGAHSSASRSHGSTAGGRKQGGGSPPQGPAARPDKQQQQQPALVLPPRAASPELPGFGISRRQARLLQTALARLGGSREAAADAATLQAVLTEVLEWQTAHVQVRMAADWPRQRLPAALPHPVSWSGCPWLPGCWG